MPSLLDIADPELSPTEIDLGGRALTIRGIKAKEWLDLYARFPELRHMVEGNDDVEMSRSRGVQIQAAVIAAGTGYIGDQRHEMAALNKLSRDELTMAVQEIISISYPGHAYGPLLNEAAADESLGQNTAKRDTK